MSVSPLRSLLFRHVCACKPSAKAPSRLLSTTRSYYDSYGSSPASFGSSESLRRRYRPSSTSQDPKLAALRRRQSRLTYGFFACAVGLAFTIYLIPDSARPQPSSKTITSNDSPALFPDSSTPQEIEQIPTGTSTIPTFPKIIHLSSISAPPASSIPETRSATEEYHLLGLGIRTVSFLGIQVYVVGIYVALPDISSLQSRLIHTVNPQASTLVAGEKDTLRDILLDPTRGEEIFNEILKDSQIRSVVRIVPTRSTDMQHLRDGFVRGITAKTQRFSAPPISDTSFSDESFGQSVNEFKAIWGQGAKKNVPKGETLLMTRDAKGELAVWYEDKKGVRTVLGRVGDERVSRLIWLGYLGGKNVSSEGARQSVIEGCVEVVGRPVGTVEGQVV